MKLFLLHLIVVKCIINLLAHLTTGEIKPREPFNTLYCRVLVRATLTARLVIDIASLF